MNEWYNIISRGEAIDEAEEEEERVFFSIYKSVFLGLTGLALRFNLSICLSILFY